MSDVFDLLQKKVFLPMRLATVRQLLRGNDTCCFTSDQYRDTYLKMFPYRAFTPEKSRELWEGDGVLTVAEKHLRSIPWVVREVSPGVWGPVECSS